MITNAIPKLMFVKIYYYDEWSPVSAEWTKLGIEGLLEVAHDPPVLKGLCINYLLEG